MCYTKNTTVKKDRQTVSHKAYVSIGKNNKQTRNQRDCCYVENKNRFQCSDKVINKLRFEWPRDGN